MGRFVPIHRGHNPRSTATTVFQHDWFGNRPRFACRFAFVQDDDSLSFHFHAPKAPDCDPHPNGAFVEGLWERDVAEFFLMGEGAAYQEFNLSPSGAWWSAHFRGYRERSTILNCPSVTTHCESGPSFWKASLSLKLADIVPIQGLSACQWRLNVSAILEPREPEYLCYGHQHGGEPDFHLRSNFVPIELRDTVPQ